MAEVVGRARMTEFCEGREEACTGWPAWTSGSESGFWKQEAELPIPTLAPSEGGDSNSPCPVVSRYDGDNSSTCVKALL